jgi:hypothetical protein
MTTTQKKFDIPSDKYRFFLDTSFLLNLTGYSKPKPGSPSLQVGASSNTNRADHSRAYWQAMLSHVAGQRLTNPQAGIFLSPMVLQEFLHICHENIKRILLGQGRFEADPAVLDGFRESFRDLLRSDSHPVDAWSADELRTNLNKMSVLNTFTRLIRREMEEYFVEAFVLWDHPGSWSEKGQWLTVWNLLEDGVLHPADSVIALSASSAKAQALVADDWHFHNASAYLRETLALEVIYLPVQ